jgi:hypothetical protein
MQSVEIGNAFGRQVNNLSVNNQWCTESRRFLHDTRITLRPIISVHRVEPHPSIADVNLQSVTVMLQFVNPARTAGWALGDDRTARMNETGRRIGWPPA